jgi:hypothetical protein
MDRLLRAALAATELGARYESARAKPRQILTALAIGWVAALFAIAALFWFDLALWFYCEPRLGAPVAAVIAGGALLLAALAAVLAILLARGRKPAPAAAPAIDPQAIAGIARELNGFVREHKALLLVAAALAGAVLGSSPPPKR